VTARGPGGRDIKLEQHLVRVRAASVGAVFLKRLSGPNGYGRGLAAAACERIRARTCSSGGAAGRVRRRGDDGAAATTSLQLGVRPCS